MKKWVNVFIDCYDETQYYVSKSYSTKQLAMSNVRPSMKGRYVNTIELNVDKINLPTDNLFKISSFNRYKATIKDKIMKLTESQREIFGKLLDKNWEAKTEPDKVKQAALYGEAGKLKQELKNAMGQEAYIKFVEEGKKLFASQNN